jgi:flagellar biosynthesis/type III secretory pathway chaperone
MDDLSPAFAAESLTVNIIEELRERLESTDDYTKQLGLITEMEEKYNLEEGILLSHILLLRESMHDIALPKYHGQSTNSSSHPATTTSRPRKRSN